MIKQTIILRRYKQVMLKLTHENFIKARDFIFAHSDDIYRAWFRYNFEDGDTDAFMNELAKYQHENGGFGGLSDEFEYPGPCLKCTEKAIGYILNLNEKPSAEHPVIQKMMAYILERYIPEIGNWGEPRVPEMNDFVHCRWERYIGETPPPMADDEERIRKYNANEQVCFAAFVAYYSEIVPEELYREIIKFPTQHILRYWDENSPEYSETFFDGPYAFEYFLDFVPCLKDKALADKLTAILRQNPTKAWELDFAKSDTDYVHLPCDYGVCSPDNIVYPVVKDLVDEALSYRIRQQCENGKWPLGWSYGDSEGMRRLEAKSDVTRTVNMLVKLNRFGRIDR